jgi:hypothetical protein
MNKPIERQDIFDDLVQGMNQMREDLKKASTHCGDLALTCMRDSEHFKRTDLHFDAEGLHAVYDCDLDGRKYDVFIKALR